MSLPNNLYMHKPLRSLKGEGLFCVSYLRLNLIKMQVPCEYGSYILDRFVQIVWLQSEFAFFVRQLRLSHFLI